MNKNLMKVAFVGVIALIAGINVYNAQKTVTLSDIAMENVETLADTELFDRITRCREHGCVIDFSWDCYYPDGGFWGICPDMRGV